MSEELNIKVNADTGTAVANLGKAEKAVDGVKQKTKELDQAGKNAGASVGQAVSQQVSAFTQLAEGLGKVTMIFGMAVAAGKALAAGIDAISASLDKAAAAEGAAIDRKMKFDKAIRLVNEGTIALGHSTEEMLKNYDEFVAKSGPAAEAAKQNARALTEEAMAWESLGRAVKEANAGRGFEIISPEDAAKQADAIKSLATGLNDALKKAFDVGGEGERDAWAAANQEAVQKVIDEFARLGLEAPDHVRKAYERMKGALAEVDPFAGIGDAYDQMAEAQKQSTAETTRAQGEMRKWTDATQGPLSALGALSGNFDSINREVAGFIAAGGKAEDVMVGMTAVTMTWNQSTEEMNRTLERQLELMGRLDEQMVKTLDKYEQWRSAIATAVSSLQDGTTSASGFIEMMNQLATQLSTNFGAAAGEAGEEVRKLIATIQALIATATTGGGAGNLDPTLWGGLERQYGAKK